LSRNRANRAEVFGFERELDAVLRMSEAALTAVDRGRGKHLDEASAGLDWRDVMAIYSRKYLEAIR